MPHPSALLSPFFLPSSCWSPASGKPPETPGMHRMDCPVQRTKPSLGVRTPGFQAGPVAHGQSQPRHGQVCGRLLGFGETQGGQPLLMSDRFPHPGRVVSKGSRRWVNAATGLGKQEQESLPRTPPPLSKTNVPPLTTSAQLNQTHFSCPEESAVLRAN